MPEDIKKWFDTIHSVLIQDGHQEVLNEPKRNFNMDEIGFMRCPEKGGVYAPIGAKNVVYLQKSKEQITVTFCFSACGEVLNPCILFKGKRMSKTLGESVPPDVNVLLNESGWQTQDTFSKWLEFFDAELEVKKVQKPVILWLDGHTSHNGLEVRKLLLSDFLKFHSFRLCKKLEKWV